MNTPDLHVFRKATWLELFFDLIFVVAVTKTAHILMHVHHGHLELSAYYKYVLVMIPVWWAWTGNTAFVNRFDNEDIIQRFMTLIQMFFVIIMAASISPDFDAYYQYFLFSYVCIRVLNILMYVRVSIAVPKTRYVSVFIAGVFLVGALISFLSVFFEGPLRYFILYAGIFFDILVPLLSKKRLKSMPLDAHHLPERYGIFTIILLGESVVSLTNSFIGLTWDSRAITMAICGFILTCSLWWAYFDNVERRLAGYEYLGHGHGIIYAHLFIYIGLGGIAAMIRFAVVPELELWDYKLLSAFGVLIFIWALEFLEFVYHPNKRRRKLVENAVVVNSLFLILVIFAPSISVLMVGTTLLMIGYAMLQGRAG